MCLFSHPNIQQTLVYVMLHFVASLYSQQNCLGTREFSFKRISKQCISLIKMIDSHIFIIFELNSIQIQIQLSSKEVMVDVGIWT